MGVPRTLPAVTVGSATSPVPAYSGTVVNAVSFSITNNIATINLGAGNLPKNGYNGPRGFGNAGPDLGVPGQGQQVSLWGFTTATYFNGKTVTVLDNDGSASFRFAFTNANVASTNDAGKTAASPFQHYRTVRIEADLGNSADTVYVGDLNVSTSRYLAALTLAGQIAIEIASENIPADRIWLVANNTSATDKVHVTLIY